MVKLIQDLWILSNSGIVVFSRAFDQKVDEQLFGGLMSALDTFAQLLRREQPLGIRPAFIQAYDLDT